MTNLYFGLAIFLLVNVLVGLLRILRGPTSADRMLTAQLFGTTGVAIMLILAEALAQPAIRTIGLVFAVLVVIAAAVFVRNSESGTRTARSGSS